MRSEPDFELLPSRQLVGARRWLLPACAAVALVSVAWAAMQWVQYQSALKALAAANAAQRTPVVATPAARPYAVEALKAAELLQAPVDNWLRELERCQPDKAQTRELRIDAVARKVVTHVEITGSPEIVEWLTCLNSGLDGSPWRMVQMSASDRPAAPSPAPTSWVVTLERFARR